MAEKAGQVPWVTHASLAFAWQEALAAEEKQAQAARQKTAEVSRAREEQLDAFKARLLAERFAIMPCNSMRFHARMHEMTTAFSALLTALSSTGILPHGSASAKQLLIG